ncbi:hypothetical protein [Micromonospora sp. R77]|uniref:hypothetical protein n=1 Tax=Micromonospora sp. R77 TaxID=2925836 RepID=UPI0035B04BF5
MMSHPDPYGATDPRGWDRPDRPPALPWPETDLEPGPRRRPGGNPEAYAEPQRRPRPTADPYAEPYARPDVDRHEPPRAGHPAPYTGQLGGPDEHPGAYDERAGRVDGRSGRDRDDHDGPGRDDEYPTAQLAPVRADVTPDPEPGRRRAAGPGGVAGPVPTGRPPSRPRPAGPAATCRPRSRSGWGSARRSWCRSSSIRWPSSG